VLEEKKNVLEEKIKETEEENLIIEGDFNARTGSEGGPMERDRGGKKKIQR